MEGIGHWYPIPEQEMEGTGTLSLSKAWGALVPHPFYSVVSLPPYMARALGDYLSWHSWGWQ